MADKTKTIEKNTPPDLILGQLSVADLSRGKELVYSHGQSGGDMGVEFSKSSLGFDFDWYKGWAEMFGSTRDKNLTSSDVINDVNPILVKSKNSERLDGNNVNVDLEISEMIKNTSYYNMLTSIVSGDFRIYRTIISAR